MTKIRLALVVGLLALTSCSSRSTASSPATSQAGAAATVPATAPSTAAEPADSTANVTGGTDAASTVAPDATAPQGTSPQSAPPPEPADDVYAQTANWICRPDITDICDRPAPVTSVGADGSLTEQPYTVAAAPPIDCFYVYPTISADESYNSDMSPDTELGAVVYQAQRFSQVCAVYAPVYRSVTAAGLAGRVQPGAGEGWPLAYGDVLAAWRHYLAYDNGGRPVVLLSHSQGSFHLTNLLRTEIDPHPEQRDLVVSAILAGASFQVAPGQDVGGDTQNMPLCRRTDQFGCIITFQSYRDDDPPEPGALFGAPAADTASACTNPAALAGGPATLKSALPAGDWVFASGSSHDTITTPFVDPAGLITGECKTRNGYSYLAITVNADQADARGDDIIGDSAPNWGLHGSDINLVQDSLIDLVQSQTTAYLAAR